MLVPDTDVVSLLQHPDTAVARRLADRLAADGRAVCVTMVTVEEQVKGRLAACAGAKSPEEYAVQLGRLRQTVREHASRQLLDFDARAVAVFKRLRAAKIRIGTMDLRIAAIVLTNGAILITRNLSDFRRIPNLRAEDWTLPL